ncbi:MAG TPA: hypothetical protein VH394_26750, partial [Thermoanaerobaculia bacterium]|nr:hypothetical protein [Thermoanaerobaculia bacterium]
MAWGTVIGVLRAVGMAARYIEMAADCIKPPPDTLPAGTDIQFPEKSIQNGSPGTVPDAADI